jgi:hypothetical protein
MQVPLALHRPRSAHRRHHGAALRQRVAARGCDSEARKTLRAPADDILDVFADLWTAERTGNGVARALQSRHQVDGVNLMPGLFCQLFEQPVRDATGLRMEMVY